MAALRHLVARLSLDQSEFDSNLRAAKSSATRFSKDLSREITTAYYGSKEEAKIQNAIAAGLEKDVIDRLREQLTLRNALLARQREMAALGANIAERWAAVDAAKAENAARIQGEAIQRRQIELERLREGMIRRSAAAAALAATPIAIHEQMGRASGQILIAERGSKGILDSFNALSRVLIRGGGIAIGLTLLLNMIERMGQNIREARKEFEGFGDSTDAVTLGVLRSLPLIGQLIRTVQDSVGAKDAIAFADELEKKRRDMEAAAKQGRDEEKRHQQEMLRLADERIARQANSYGAAITAAEHMETFTKAMQDQLSRTIAADDPAALARIQYDATKDAIHKAYLDALNEVRGQNIETGFKSGRIDEIQANFDEAMRLLEEQYKADLSRIKTPNEAVKEEKAVREGYRPVGAALAGSQEVFTAIARAQAPQEKSLDQIAKNTKATADAVRKPGTSIIKVGP